MMRTKICARCGKQELESDPFVGAFCPECLMGEMGAVTSGTAGIQFCTRCERIRINNRWVEETPKELIAVALTKIKSRYPIAKTTLTDVLKQKSRWVVGLKLEISTSSRALVREEKTIIDVKRVRCRDCVKMSSGYHELILQIRGPENKVAKFAARAKRELDPYTMVTKTEEKDGGIDLYVADKHPAMTFVMRLHRPYKATRKLKGVRKGKHHFITTICVRLQSPQERLPHEGVIEEEADEVVYTDEE